MKAIDFTKRMDLDYIQALNCCKENEKNNAARPFLCHIYWDAEKKNLVGTDGKRLGVCAVHDEELIEQLGTDSCFFDLNGKMLVETADQNVGNFPYYWRVIPNRDKMKEHTLHTSQSLLKKSATRGHQIMLGWSLITGSYFDVQFADVLKFIGQSDMTVYLYDNQKECEARAQIIETGRFTYVVMPRTSILD